MMLIDDTFAKAGFSHVFVVAVPIVLLVATITTGVFLVIAFLIWCVYYSCCIAEKPRLFHGAKVKPIIARCTSLSSKIYYTPWALSGHIQAILFALWPQMSCRHRLHRCNEKREVVTLRDGGEIALDWCIVGECSNEALDVVVLIIPGIVGKRGNAYITRFSQVLHSQKGASWRCVVKSWRGITCPLAASQPRPESWDDHSVKDTIEVAEHIKKHHPGARLVCLGFSHGGNVGLGALADPSGGLFSAGVMLSAPYDLEAAMAWLEQRSWFPFAFLNTKKISSEYEKSGAKKVVACSLPGGPSHFCNIDKELSWKNLAAHLCVRRRYGSTWHDRITRHYTGHTSVQDYYRSSAQMVRDALLEIRTPVLCLLAEDDPVTPFSTFKKFTQEEQSPWVVFLMTKRGGHCGWFYGFRGLSWIDEVAIEFFDACFTEKLGK